MIAISQTFKKLFDFYIFSNIHVALAAFALTKITLLNIGISDNTTPIFVFFSTLLSYNLIRFMRINTIKSWFINWFKENKKSLIVICFLSVVFLFFLVFKIRFKALLVLAPFSLFTLLYTFPIKKFALREKSGVKLLLIALSWAGITVLFPLVQHYIQPRLTDYIVFLQRFLFVLAITIPFDIRDLKYDNDKMKTLPQVFGITKSKWIALVALSIFFLLDFIMDVPNKIKLVDFFIALLSGILIYKMRVNISKYYTSFIIEGIPILWLIIWILCKINL